MYSSPLGHLAQAFFSYLWRVGSEFGQERRISVMAQRTTVRLPSSPYLVLERGSPGFRSFGFSRSYFSGLSK